MIHTNTGELLQLFSTFNQVWGSGGTASLTLKTVDGKVSALLELQLGLSKDLRPGAPEAGPEAAGSECQPHAQQRRRRHRGPGRQARDAARRDAWRVRRREHPPTRQAPFDTGFSVDSDKIKDAQNARQPGTPAAGHKASEEDDNVEGDCPLSQILTCL